MINSDTVALEKFLWPMARGPSRELARALVNLTADAEMQARYDFLADRRTEAQLTPAEEEELESLVRVNTLRSFAAFVSTSTISFPGSMAAPDLTCIRINSGEVCTI